MATTQEVLDHHMQCFGAADLDGILADYTDQSVLMTPMGTIDNVAGLRELFVGFFEEFGQEGVTFELLGTWVSGDLAVMNWKGETPNNVYSFATDTFLVRDGKIERQTFTGDITPKG